MSHHLITRDGYSECYACGTAADDTADLARVACKPGGWTHPAYIVGGEIETCTAHETYECAHLAFPSGDIVIDPRDEDCATSTCDLCGFPVEYDPRNAWTHAPLWDEPRGAGDSEPAAFAGGPYSARSNL